LGSTTKDPSKPILVAKMELAIMCLLLAHTWTGKCIYKQELLGTTLHTPLEEGTMVFWTGDKVFLLDARMICIWKLIECSWDIKRKKPKKKRFYRRKKLTEVGARIYLINGFFCERIPIPHPNIYICVQIFLFQSNLQSICLKY
jgi:hypothetical protein